MVRAIMSGKKTQTRRIINANLDSRPPYTIRDNGYVWSAYMTQQWTRGGRALKCPFGNVGDRLFVKEGIEGRNDTKLHDGEQMPITAYSADGSHIWDGPKRLPWRWKPKSLPSIYMPKELCRIKLDITNVRIERLQEITPNDAINEGCCPENGNEWDKPEIYRKAAEIVGGPFPRGVFAMLWNQINGEESWKSNPYVWVIEFKKVVAS